MTTIADASVIYCPRVGSMNRITLTPEWSNFQRHVSDQYGKSYAMDKVPYSDMLVQETQRWGGTLVGPAYSVNQVIFCSERHLTLWLLRWSSQ